MRTDVLRDPDKERVVDVEGFAGEGKQNEDGGDGQEPRGPLRKPINPNTARHCASLRLGCGHGYCFTTLTWPVAAS